MNSAARRDRVVAALTIGQSPRDDITPEIQPFLGTGVRLVEAGVLDGLGEAELAALAPHEGDEVLVTRLRDGSQVKVAHRHVAPRLQALVNRLMDSADLFLVLCTGGFPELRSPKPVLLPDRLLFAVVEATFSGGCLGVLTPVMEQAAQQERRWSRVAHEVMVAAASPYQNDGARIEAAARELARRGAELIVMDCLGYTSAMKERVRAATGRPVILARSLLARMAAELL